MPRALPCWQMEAFQQQLSIAAALGRPASVHCVKAHGTLLDCLREPHPPWLLQLPESQLQPRAGKAPAGARLPPALAMHSFSGTSHQVTAILGRRLLS